METDCVTSTELRSEWKAEQETRRAYRELSSKRLNRLDHSRIVMRDSCNKADITMTMDIIEKAAVTLSKTTGKEIYVRESATFNLVFETLQIKVTYLMKFVDTTTIETARLTMTAGKAMIDARALSGKYSERMTPSQGKKTPTVNS
jgi:hypothetical protein